MLSSRKASSSSENDDETSEDDDDFVDRNKADLEENPKNVTVNASGVVDTQDFELRSNVADPKTNLAFTNANAAAAVFFNDDDAPFSGQRNNPKLFAYSFSHLFKPSP